MRNLSQFRAKQYAHTNFSGELKMMHRYIRRCLLGTAFAGGLLAFGGVAANAADTTTSGNDGLLSGTQVVAPINIPVNLGATSLGLVGDSAAGTQNAGTPAAPA